MLPSIPLVRTDYPRLRPLSDHLNTVGDRSNLFLPAIGGSGVGVDSVPGAGSRILVDVPPIVPQWELAIVQATGPAAAADYTNNRYWVKFAYLDQGVADTDTTTADAEVDDATSNVAFTATNLSELSTHLLVEGQIVMIQQVRGRSSSGRTINQWIMKESPFGFFPVIVKANGTSGGNPTYDLYAPADTGYVTKLNSTFGARVPRCSRARMQTTILVTAAPDGSDASAVYDSAGIIQLFDLPETVGGCSE